MQRSVPCRTSVRPSCFLPVHRVPASLLPPKSLTSFHTGLSFQLLHTFLLFYPDHEAVVIYKEIQDTVRYLAFHLCPPCRSALSANRDIFQALLQSCRNIAAFLLFFTGLREISNAELICPKISVSGYPAVRLADAGNKKASVLLVLPGLFRVNRVIITKFLIQRDSDRIDYRIYRSSPSFRVDLYSTSFAKKYYQALILSNQTFFCFFVEYCSTCDHITPRLNFCQLFFEKS